MAYTRSETVDPTPGTGDTVKQAVLDLDTDLTRAYTFLNQVVADWLAANLTEDGDLVVRDGVSYTGKTIAEIWPAIVPGFKLRSKWSVSAANTVAFTKGVYEVGGTLVSLAASTHALVNRTANAWTYIFLSDAGVLSDSTTAPTINADGVAYSADGKRCVFQVLMDGSGNMLPFVHDGGRVRGYGISDLSWSNTGTVAGGGIAVTITIPATTRRTALMLGGQGTTSQANIYYYRTGVTDVTVSWTQYAYTETRAYSVYQIVDATVDSADKVNLARNNSGSELGMVVMIGYELGGGQ